MGTQPLKNIQTDSSPSKQVARGAIYGAAVSLIVNGLITLAFRADDSLAEKYLEQPLLYQWIPSLLILILLVTLGIHQFRISWWRGFGAVSGYYLVRVLFGLLAPFLMQL